MMELKCFFLQMGGFETLVVPGQIMEGLTIDINWGNFLVR
jgi:hypothetical protein